MDAAVQDDIGEKAAALDPTSVAPRTGAYTVSNNNSTGYDYAPQKGGTPGGYGGSGGGAMSSGYGYNNNSSGNNNSNWGGEYGQPPPTGSMGGGGMMMSPQQQYYGAGPPRQLSSASSSSGSMGSSRSWGSQPPLTSSKRDQNWERKRRQWLARKNGAGSAGFSSGGRLHSAGPPGSSYGIIGGMGGSNMGGGMAMNPWEDQGNANAPPSPLSKFVHQQSQKQQQHGGFNNYVDYERIGTAQSQAPSALPPPPATAAYPRGDTYSSSGYPYAPPSRSSGPYSPPSSSGAIDAQGRMGMSHFNSPPLLQAASEFGYGNATPASRGGTAVAGVSTSGGNNMANRNVSSARQPPGGHSNWSPFS